MRMVEEHAMARPKLNAQDRRTRRIVFRVTEREFERLCALAAAANLRINQLARRAVLSRADKLKIETHSVTDPALLTRLDRIGHNLNQLVKNAHIFGRVSPQVPELCRRIDALMDEAIDRGSES